MSSIPRPGRAPTVLVLSALLAACGPETGGGPSRMVRDTSATGLREVHDVWAVMGTVLAVSAWAHDTAGIGAALGAARAAIFRVDTLMSVYKPASDLSVVNRRAGTDTSTVVDSETARVLGAALHYAELTDGALDVTVGPLVDVWGFYRHQGRVPPAAVIDSAGALVGYRLVQFDSLRRTVRLPRRGMRLDFGAIAKGFAVDRAVAVLRQHGLVHAMVDLGGNVRVLGTSPRGGSWSVGLRDPRAPDRIFATLALDSGAVATSGDYEQFFELEGVRYSHIFDPTTRRPAHGIASTTIQASTGMAADALSTALFVLGSARGCTVAGEIPTVGVVWVRDPGPIRDGISAHLDPDLLTLTRDLEGVLRLVQDDREVPVDSVAVRWCPGPVVGR